MEDFSKSKSISFDYNDEDSDERTILISRVKNIRIYEQLFRKKKVSYCPSLISCWSILTKLKDEDKQSLSMSNVDWSFYSDLFVRTKDIIGYDAYPLTNAKLRNAIPKLSLSIYDEIVWFWRPIDEPIVFPYGKLLIVNNYGFDIPFYTSLFYLNYKHLTAIHLHFIHSSTIFSKESDRLPILTAMSKVWFDVRSAKASRWKLALEQYLQDALEFSKPEIYHHLLHSSILRIWRHVSTRKFINKYLNLFDKQLREDSSTNSFRSDFKVRSYVFSRIIQYRFSKTRKLNDFQIRSITDFFEKWSRAGLYQMAYPCSFFVSRKKMWNELILTRRPITTCIDNYEFIYLDRMTALRDLPSINLMNINENEDESKKSSTLSSSSKENENIVVINVDSNTSDDNVNNAYLKTRCNALRLCLQTNDDNVEKYTRFLNVLFFTNNTPNVFSTSYAKLKAYHEFDKENLTSNELTLRIWEDMTDVIWTTHADSSPSKYNYERRTTMKIYEFAQDRIFNFLTPNYSSNINVLLNRREVGLTDNLKSINVKHWKENGFEKQSELLDSSIYANRYFYSDILKLMSFFLLR